MKLDEFVKHESDEIDRYFDSLIDDPEDDEEEEKQEYLFNLWESERD